jgi:ferredoxin-NADP reductase
VSGAPPTRPWEHATVVSIEPETARVATFRLRFATPVDFLPGQHVVVRLTAPDGYRAQRSYSIASAPDGGDELDLAVERLDDGEVSGFLHDGVEVGDSLEVRGPIGGWFTWTGETPALLIGGGTGVVPLMSMLRHARATGGDARLLVSVRTPADLLYASELRERPDTTVVYSRVTPPGSMRPAGRIGRDDVAALLAPGATTYLCGSSGFVEATSALLVELGTDAATVRIERFGPS